MTLSDCRILELPKVRDHRGNLTYIESGLHVPFELRRVFYLYDVPADSTRAGHALRTCEQFLVAVSGAFDVVLDDGGERQRFRLDRPYFGIHVPPLIWRELDNFSSGSICLVLASEPYDEAGYLRDYDAFVAAVGRRP